MHTGVSNLKLAPSVPPLLRDTVSVNGRSIDMKGFDGLIAIYQVGANDIASTFELEDSADDSSFADVDLPSTAATEITTAANEVNAAWLIDIKAVHLRRYVRVQHTGGNGTLGCNGAACLIAYRGNSFPVTQPAGADATLGIVTTTII